MKKYAFFTVIFFLIASVAYCEVIESSINYGRFGKVTLYYSTPKPSRVVLFISGDGGWNKGVVDMAREISGFDALVVGIDITHYIGELNKSTETCLYPAGDLESLSKFIQGNLKYPQYIIPTLIGYSSGATLVYAALVQAPPATFRGAISMGFCPDLKVSKPLCRGEGLEFTLSPKKEEGYIFKPASNLEVPWIVLHGTDDQVCNLENTTKFVNQVKNAEIVILQKVGHGFSVPRNWLPQLEESFSKIAEKTKPVQLTATLENLNDLPLVEIPSKASDTQYIAVLISGDGGWNVTERGISQSLSDHGIPVVGLNSLHYFWKKRTPEESSKDLERVLRNYLGLWKKNNCIIVGYSLGADVMPFMISRLPQDLYNRVQLMVFLGPSTFVNFQFHMSEWIGNFHDKDALQILPEVKKLKPKKNDFFFR